MLRATILFLLLPLTAAVTAVAQAPSTISHQGMLTDLGGTPVADAARDMTFKIYNVVSNGSALWTETKSVSTVNGVFNTILGSDTPITGVSFDQPMWLGVKVGADAEMTDRVPLTSVPSSFALVLPYSGKVDTSPAVFTIENQSGGAIYGISSGTGVPGRFRVANASSPAAAIFAETDGTGKAILAVDPVEIRTQSIGENGTQGANEDLILESTDAQMGLYSNPGGSAGSGIQFGEIESGLLTNKWSMFRETTGGGLSMLFTFGTDPAYGANPTMFEIDTSGVVSASAVKYLAPRTHYASVHPAAFAPTITLVENVWENWRGYFTAGVVNEVAAGIQLPQGAKITAFRCGIYDVDATVDLACSLFKNFGDSSSSSFLIAQDENESSSGAHTIEITGLNSIVDNVANAYFVSVEATGANWSTAGSDVQIRYASVEYTVVTAE